jgi:MraZ protein
MWKRFTSSSVHKVDAKGRVSVPAGFRRVLEGGESADPALFLIPKMQRQPCLTGFTPDHIRNIDAAISRMRPFSPERQKLERQFMARAIPMNLDENGRINLSPKLQAQVGLEDQALFVGMGASFQIWNPELYEESYEDEAEEDISDALEAMPWEGGE